MGFLNYDVPDGSQDSKAFQVLVSFLPLLVPCTPSSSEPRSVVGPCDSLTGLLGYSQTPMVVFSSHWLAPGWPCWGGIL